MEVHEVENDEEFTLLIETAGESLVAVDFYAVWCGPCKQISPFFDQLCKRYTNVLFFRVDVDKLKLTAMKYQVSAMPTFGFFRGGQQIDKLVGANPTALEQKIQFLSTGGAPSTTPNPAQNAPVRPPTNFFNLDLFIVFDTGKTEQILEKLLQFNTKLASSESTKNFSLSDSEVKQLKNAITTINNVSYYHATKFSPEELGVMQKLLRWPTSERFPALDLLRLHVLHPEAAAFYAKNGALSTMVEYLKDSSSPFTVHMMALRFIANSFKHEVLRNVAVSQFNTISDVSKPFLKHENKNIRAAVATAFLNYAIHFGEAKQNQAERTKLVGILTEAIPSENDEEAQYRISIALGVLAYKNAEAKAEMQKNLGIFKAVKGVSKKVQDPLVEFINILENKQAPAFVAPMQIRPPQQPQNTQPMNQPMMPPMGMPGMGMPGMGGNPQLPPGVNYDMLNKIATSPEIIRAMQNPQLMSKLQEVMADPSKAMLYQSDPEFAALLQAMMRTMQQ